jgi:chemotaxis response regulator CheB
VVDDSASFRAALARALAREESIEIVGQADDGKSAIAAARSLRPDVVLMDVLMPELGGIAATKRIMATAPVPIVLMSNIARTDEQRAAFTALGSGAIDVINKPVLVGLGAPASVAALVSTLQIAATANVSRAARAQPRGSIASVARRVEIVAIAASTGGPPAIAQVLAARGSQGAPVVIAQHLAPSFARGFADWLGGVVPCRVVYVERPRPLQHGVAYVAADGNHLVVSRGMVSLAPARKTELSPSADLLFRSVAEAYREQALGIVLTGMGTDGAVGLRAIRLAGGWTIGQDADSSTVFGMPAAAAAADACCAVQSLDEIARFFVGSDAASHPGAR